MLSMAKNCTCTIDRIDGLPEMGPRVKKISRAKNYREVLTDSPW